MIFLHIIGSWLPAFSFHPLLRFVARYTEPFLGIFRKIVPPIGGVLDLSPLLALFALKLLKSFLLSISLLWRDIQILLLEKCVWSLKNHRV